MSDKPYQRPDSVASTVTLLVPVTIYEPPTVEAFDAAAGEGACLKAAVEQNRYRTPANQQRTALTKYIEENVVDGEGNKFEREKGETDAVYFGRVMKSLGWDKAKQVAELGEVAQGFADQIDWYPTPGGSRGPGQKWLDAAARVAASVDGASDKVASIIEFYSSYAPVTADESFVLNQQQLAVAMRQKEDARKEAEERELANLVG